MAESEVAVLATHNIIDRINALQKALAAGLPNYESILYQVHRQLAEDDSLVHILTEEQIGVIVSGLSRKKNVLLVKQEIKKVSSNKKLGQTTVDDL